MRQRGPRAQEERTRTEGQRLLMGGMSTHKVAARLGTNTTTPQRWAKALRAAGKLPALPARDGLGAKIERLLADGKPVKDVVKATGAKETRVRAKLDRMRRAGTLPAADKRQPYGSRRPEAERLLKEGKQSQAKIAEGLGCNVSTVSRWAFEMRERGDLPRTAAPRPRKPAPLMVSNAPDLDVETRTRAIAADIGMDPAHVVRALLALGLARYSADPAALLRAPKILRDSAAKGG